MNVLDFTSKVESNTSTVEDWEEFLRVMDAFLKQGVKVVLLDYKDNDEDSTLHIYFEILRKIFEEPKKYRLPKEIEQNSILRKALLDIYERCGDLIAQLLFNNTTNITKAIRLLREKAGLVQKELVKLLTIVVLTSMINNKTIVEKKNTSTKFDIHHHNSFN